MVSDGEKTYVGGEGALFELFVDKRQVSNYVGEGQSIASVNDPNYTSAKLCLVRFDQSFSKLPHDARAREYDFLLSVENFFSEINFSMTSTSDYF